MAKYTINDTTLTSIADAIRAKGGTTAALTPAQMAEAIAAIQAGGGENCIPYEESVYLKVAPVYDAQYGFALNRNGYYESQNKGVGSSCALCRVRFVANESCSIAFSVINYADSGYDYGLFGALDTALTKDINEDSGVKKSYKNEHSANATSLVYEDIPPGDHFIDVKFIKDSWGDGNNDSLQFKVTSFNGKTVSIASEYYPLISKTEPVIDALTAISLKGVDTIGAGFDDIAGLVAMIQDTKDAWYQTGEITFAEDLSNATQGWILPIDDSNGVPEVVGVFRKATATETSLTDNMLCAVAAPKLMPYAYVYGQTGKYNTFYPEVIDNDKAINKKDYGTSQYGNYAVVMPIYMQNYKLRAGDTYIWFAIGGLPE